MVSNAIKDFWVVEYSKISKGFHVEQVCDMLQMNIQALIEDGNTGQNNVVLAITETAEEANACVDVFRKELGI